MTDYTIPTKLKTIKTLANHYYFKICHSTPKTNKDLIDWVDFYNRLLDSHPILKNRFRITIQ